MTKSELLAAVLAAVPDDAAAVDAMAAGISLAVWGARIRGPLFTPPEISAVGNEIADLLERKLLDVSREWEDGR
jgi:hypothetical protein